MEKVIEVLFIVLVSTLIVNEFWRMQIAIKRETRTEVLDLLLTIKLMRDLDIKSFDELEEVYKNEII